MNVHVEITFRKVSISVASVEDDCLRCISTKVSSFTMSISSLACAKRMPTKMPLAQALHCQHVDDLRHV